MAIIVFDPLEFLPLHWVVTTIGIVIILMTILWFLGTPRDIRRLRRFLMFLFTSLATIFLIVAAWNPVSFEPPQVASKPHLSVVLDVSDSTLRTTGGWDSIYKATRALLVRGGLADLPENIDPQTTASIVTFRDGVSQKEFTLDTLINGLDHLDPSIDFAGGEGSNIGAGLERAASLIARAGGSGGILLVSDGNDTVGHAIEVAQQIAQQGITIHVLPISSSNPELAITSANFANQVNAGASSILRGVIYNTSSEDVNATLSILRNPGVADEAKLLVGPEANSVVTYDPLPANAFHPLRIPISFTGLGIQFVDLNLVNARSETSHRRRFFTLVTRPIKLLAVGGDLTWMPAISPDFAVVDSLSLGDPRLLNVDLSLYDGIVLSEVPATLLDKSLVARLADAVKQDNLGLFLINGDHEGAKEDVNTILSTYSGTPLAPLLPVSTTPRPTTVEPPPRHLVILLDSSGSMGDFGGWPLDQAKKIAQYIINTYLRPQDTLDLVTFNVTATQLVINRNMDAAGKQDAIDELSAIVAGGGTQPEDALQLVKEKMSNCGLIFISDGIFDSNIAQYRPDCRVTAFQIGSAVVDPNSPMYSLADPFGVDQSFDPRRIQIPYFQPEKRNKYFENGTFKPIPMTQVFGNLVPPIPLLDINGAAVTYPLETADIMAVRPKFADPILIYNDADHHHVGVFTAGFTPEWINSNDGKNAIQSWLARIVPYSARDRYVFNITHNGEELILHIELKNPDESAPDVTSLHAQINSSKDNHLVFSMQPVPASSATFEGSTSVPQTDTTLLGTLVLQETGTEALGQPQQIPILLPMKGSIDTSNVTEATSYGLNKPVLQKMTEISGGTYDPGQDFQFFHQITPIIQTTPLWPLCIMLGAICYLIAIAIYKMNLIG